MADIDTQITNPNIQHTCPNDIARYFHDLDDPRSHVNRLHPLSSVLVSAIMAILAGAKGPTSIARWAKTKASFLSSCLPLPHGVPRKDVFRVVLSRLSPKVFQACFAKWLQSLKLKGLENCDIQRPIFAVDGKTNRRSHDHANGLGALHSVTIWASELGLTLAQVACAEKSNEITAIPEVLRLIDITGAIITIDAMGCQKEIAKEIIHRKADFVLGLKGNQGTLHKEVMNYVNKHIDNNFADVNARQTIVTETSHGRAETRTYVQFPVPAELTTSKEWVGLKTIGMVTRCYTQNGEEYSDVRYFISSLKLGVKEFARAVRQHWGTENGQHWILDMTFREDESRIRGKEVRENFAWLNRLALSLLKQHPEGASIALKRQSCGWDDNYLLQVLTGIMG